MYEVTIGQDLSCYATIQIPEDTPLTRETLMEIVNHVLDNQEWKGEEVYMEEDWSSVCAARVVSVRDKKGNHLVENMAIDPSPYDAGQTLMSWLRGYGPTLETMLNSAAQARLIDEAVTEAFTGYLKLPGADRVQVDFMCRKGATQEENDLAFLQALAQIGTVDYVAVGEKEVCHE
ncbi:hypothetical protein [Burkholderia multivorans]|uniref:hypothetical protein n=1 Tax=Burkholderia multivorans TaxID=87883 RepID=UPI00286042A1|nr:hypothetical protein [Burkholderia multivorans]MDR9060624.1 hypothetical protein [Burkholderia multivorans]MDR9084101.1 hypothetical protein [Burkholderia multivorans]MDR9096308.1 hypothetical protein [Burkholderia multivorans]MDR9101549.1 hypothetical protein [Burkholderia multivorans]MDR9119947.1 hypothetical protein [Burkholderia multivorans]